jgi:hypothetical protein
MEYLFKKDELLKLLFDATDSNTIAISVTYKHTTEKDIFTAEIIAKPVSRDPATGKQENSVMAAPLRGCPNPPGC